MFKGVIAGRRERAPLQDDCRPDRDHHDRHRTRCPAASPSDVAAPLVIEVFQALRGLAV